ncbi:hypothetical protein [Phocaeicola sartorii]|uniref:hypothetical protein n=1 Tax=Phocaeicola sartorii TaxID=671267 RepID=UPI002593C9CF|nr:hypothetical protein [Phocaeicola sartorii]
MQFIRAISLFSLVVFTDRQISVERLIHFVRYTEMQYCRIVIVSNGGTERPFTESSKAFMEVSLSFDSILNRGSILLKSFRAIFPVRC